nr:hypothetical protein RSP673_21945 [Ralstonia solanacearum P673]
MMGADYITQRLMVADLLILAGLQVCARNGFQTYVSRL